MDVDDLNNLKESLEQQELIAPNGIASIDVYKQLLTVYLIQNEILNAKFLWKRIPEQLKNDNNEILNLWKIGQYLWKREFPNVYTAVSSMEWSPLLQPMLVKLVEELRNRLLRLVGNAYSIIKIDTLCQMLGLAETEVVEIILSKAWEIDLDKKIVKPSPFCREKADVKYATQDSDALMGCLTDYITFLEN